MLGRAGEAGEPDAALLFLASPASSYVTGQVIAVDGGPPDEGGARERYRRPLVIGGGMAGLTAAARAARRGMEVVLAESAPNLGSSALYAGYLWTAPTIEAMREANPNGDPDLAQAVVEGFDDAVAFLGELGVPCGPAAPILRFGRGHQFDTALFVDTCRKVVTANGGRILTSTATEKLLTDVNGAVTGAELRLANGASPQSTLQRRWSPRAASRPLPRCGRSSCIPRRPTFHYDPTPTAGDGLRLAEAAGAAIGNRRAASTGMSSPPTSPSGPSTSSTLRTTTASTRCCSTSAESASSTRPLATTSRR